MNVSASASAPDLASLLLLLALSPDTAASLSGSAPTHPPKPGAETPHSFESALAEILSADEKPEDKAEDGTKQPETKTVITGVAIPLPAPAVPAEPLTLQLGLRAVRTAVKAELAESSAPTKEAGAPARTFPGYVANLEPVASPQPLAIDVDQAPRPPESAPQNTAVVPDVPIAEDLPHPAFVERFTPVPVEVEKPVQAPAQPARAPAAIRPSAGDERSAESPKAPNPVVKTEAPEAASEHRRDSDRHEARDDRPRPASQESQPSRTQSDTAVHELPRFDQPAAAAPGPRPAASGPSPRFAESPVDVEPAHVQPAPAVNSADAHSISLRVTDADDQKVDLKITDRAGELKVSVRAADPGLAGSLRENLGDLVHKLEQSGLRAETWSASAPDSIDAPHRTSHADGEAFGGDHSGGQQQQAGDGRDRRQQDRPQRAFWLEELETSIAPDPERNTTTWLPT